MLESGQMDTAALKSFIVKGSIWLAQAGFVAGSAFASIHFSLEGVKTNVSELRVEVKELRSETRADIAMLRSETKADIAALRSETRADIRRLEGLIRENNRRTDQKIDGLNQRIDQLYELLISLQNPRDKNKAAVKASALSAGGCLVCVLSHARQPVYFERQSASPPAAFSAPFLAALIRPAAGMNNRLFPPLCAARGFTAAAILSLTCRSRVSPGMVLSAGLAPAAAPGFSAAQGVAL